MPKLNARSSRTLRGIVLPDEWDDDDEVASVYIAADDDETYYVAPTEEGPALAGYLDSYVEVKGTVEEVDDEYVITVHYFTEVEEDYERDDEDGGFVDYYDF